MSLHRCSFNFLTISSNNMAKPRKCNVGKLLNFTGYVTTFTGHRRSCCCYRHFIILIQSVLGKSELYEFYVIHTVNPKGSHPTEAYDYVLCFSRRRSLWIAHWYRCLYTQSIKYKQLRTCNRRESLLYGVVITTIWTCTC